MATQPNRTVLDAELLSIANRAKAEMEEKPRVLLLEEAVALGPAAMDAAPPPPPETTSVKLLVGPGREEEAGAWVEERGGRVVSAGSRVLLVELPSEAVLELDDRDWARRAEAPRHLLPRLDQARGAATGLDRAVDQQGLSGAGVVVGIVDSGLDWSHPDFQNPDGSTRLEFFGHAHVPDGSEVSALEEFDRTALDQALQGQGNVPLGDPHGHGTHCASIAAGNGRASNDLFRGAAPDATLMGVRSEPLLDTHTIWGIRRIFELAGDRPAVVSLSLGGHWGPHDGTTALENTIARESGPGRIVVVAAGNEGSDGIHFRAELEEGRDLVIPCRIGDAEFQFVDVWIDRDDRVDVVVETPDGAQFEPDGEVVSTVFGFFLAQFREDALNRDQNLTLRVAGGRQNHVWKIRLRPSRVLHGEVHAWAGTRDPSTAAHLFTGAPDPAFSIGMPATEERAIAVGSAVSRTSAETVGALNATGLDLGGLSFFSSHGPTRYGGFKPDVTAPGHFVTAALASDCEMATAERYMPRHHPNGPYITIQGTSMATPFVAGVVALLLEREPELIPEEIQKRLRVTCRRDSQTGRVWHPGFGFGKLDVEALLDFQS